MHQIINICLTLFGPTFLLKCDGIFLYVAFQQKGVKKLLLKWKWLYMHFTIWMHGYPIKCVSNFLRVTGHICTGVSNFIILLLHVFNFTIHNLRLYSLIIVVTIIMRILLTSYLKCFSSNVAIGWNKNKLRCIIMSCRVVGATVFRWSEVMEICDSVGVSIFLNLMRSSFVLVPSPSIPLKPEYTSISHFHFSLNFC